MNVKIFSGGVGINNKVPAHRLHFDESLGVAAFEEASEVLVGMTGDTVSRKGNSLVIAGNFHSAYKFNDESFYVVQQRTSDSALYRAVVNSSGGLTLNGIRSGMSNGLQMSYFRLDNKVFYSNSVERGCLSFDSSVPWPSSVWTGTDDSAGFGNTPIGTHIELFNGRAIVSVGKELFYTEYGLLNVVDLVRNRRRFESKIIMIKSVQDGMFVSDEASVYFLQGRDPSKWTIRKVLNYPAVEWAVNDDLIDTNQFGIDGSYLACLFGTSNGPVIGLPDGRILNFIDKVVSMPQNCGTKSGAIMVVDETVIIQSGE